MKRKTPAYSQHHELTIVTAQAERVEPRFWCHRCRGVGRYCTNMMSINTTDIEGFASCPTCKGSGLKPFNPTFSE